ncbi:glutathione S-transferase C-terminal domain-containing protein [Streptosporangium sp. V21-05]|uniref:glutathione S-transferase C-terminal domain-containing protein n=1 Tax=Streptosporangium sp. V21-05 TaxID=3446115 RepID=UPI003F52B43C
MNSLKPNSSEPRPWRDRPRSPWSRVDREVRSGVRTRDVSPDLYPEPLRAEIDELNEQIFHDVNIGVYEAGMATTQQAYSRAYDALFARLDALEERLGTRRYLVGDTITEADIRLFTSLVRFDVVYHGHFRCNRSKLTEMPALWDSQKYGGIAPMSWFLVIVILDGCEPCEPVRRRAAPRPGGGSSRRSSRSSRSRDGSPGRSRRFRRS